MKKMMLCLLICLLCCLFFASVCFADSRIVPFEVEGAEHITQYRYRVLKTMKSDTSDPRPGWVWSDTTYGEWGQWSEWSTNAAEASDTLDVDFREGSEGETEYRTRSRTCQYVFTRWAPWTKWSDERVTELANRQVETRIVSVVNIGGTTVNTEETRQITMLAGTAAQFSVPVAAGAVNWWSEDSSVACVDATGYVTARSSGDTQIYTIDERGICNLGVDVHVIADTNSIPAGVDSIETEAFSGTSFSAVDLRKAPLTSIGARAFADCDSLRLVLTNHMEGTFGEDVFAGSEKTTVASVNEDNAFVYAQVHGLPRYIIRSARTYIPVSGIMLNKTNLNLNIGDSVQMQASVFPAGATESNVIWSVAGNAVDIDQFGHVDAVSPGTAVITASSADGSRTAECTVTVGGIQVTSVTLNQTSLELTVNESARLTATVLPVDATDASIFWTSSNPNVASVIRGVVTANSPGTAVISAKSHNDTEQIASCEVTVSEIYCFDDSAFSNITVYNAADPESATIHTEVSTTFRQERVGFYFGTDPDDLQLISSQEPYLGINVNQLSYKLSDWNLALEKDTEYYFRFFVTSGNNTYFSVVTSFITTKSDDRIIDESRFQSIQLSLVGDSSVRINAKVVVSDTMTDVGCVLSAVSRGDWIPTNFQTESGPHGSYLTEEDYIFGFGLFNGYHEFEYYLFMECEDGRYYSETRHFTTPCSITFELDYKDTIRIPQGEEIQLNPVVSPASAELTWSSSDPSVISVSNDGKIKAIAEAGSVLIEVMISTDTESVRAYYSAEVNAAVIRVVTIGMIRYNSSESDQRNNYLANELSHGFNEENGLDRSNNLITMGCNAENIVKAYRGSSTSVKETKDFYNLVTPGEVNSMVSSVLSKADDNDLTIIYFGGHGQASPDETQYASQLLTGKAFFDRDYGNLASLGHGTKVFIVDTCHSGGVVNYFNRVGTPGNDVYVLASCPIDFIQASRAGGRSTYLVYYYLKGITEYAPGSAYLLADKNRDHKITFNEIFSYVHYCVVDATLEVENGELIKQEPLRYIPTTDYDPVIFIQDAYQ